MSPPCHSWRELVLLLGLRTPTSALGSGALTLGVNAHVAATVTPRVVRTLRVSLTDPGAGSRNLRGVRLLRLLGGLGATSLSAVALIDLLDPITACASIAVELAQNHHELAVQLEVPPQNAQRMVNITNVLSGLQDLLRQILNRLSHQHHEVRAGVDLLDPLAEGVDPPLASGFDLRDHLGDLLLSRRPLAEALKSDDHRGVGPKLRLHDPHGVQLAVDRVALLQKRLDELIERLIEDPMEVRALIDQMEVIHELLPKGIDATLEGGLLGLSLGGTLIAQALQRLHEVALILELLHNPQHRFGDRNATPSGVVRCGLHEGEVDQVVEPGVLLDQTHAVAVLGNRVRLETLGFRRDLVEINAVALDVAGREILDAVTPGSATSSRALGATLPPLLPARPTRPDRLPESRHQFVGCRDPIVGRGRIGGLPLGIDLGRNRHVITSFGKSHNF